ncbi:ParA family protein [Alteromonas gracilis]|uniref:ParA family protein n=1 Tax=Alteromonas gracilis TaxID=1479524 RepID=UPI003736F09E
MITVVFNQKGGVGKSTISTNLAAQSAKLGYKTLLIDLDAQGNSTHYAGVDITHDMLTVADMFKQVVGIFRTAKKPVEFVHPTPFENLFVMPASPALSDVERELESRYKIFKLRDALKELRNDFDNIYIDTPPNFDFYSKAALIAAEGFCVPFDCDDFSAQAIVRLLDNALELKEDHNPELRLLGIVVNQFNSQANLPRELVNSLQSQNLPVLDSYLSSTVKVKESHSKRIPLPFYLPKHKVAGQLAALFEELHFKDER